MAYKKVYYKELWDRSNSIQKACASWSQSTEAFNGKVKDLMQNDGFKGKGADEIKAYFSDIHKVLPQLIGSLSSTLALLAIDYYGYYKIKVDKGSGKGSSEWYTTFKADELKPNGTVDNRFKEYMKIADFIRDEANRISRSVNDLAYLPQIKDDDIINKLKRAAKYATEVNGKIESYEAGLISKLNSAKDLLAQINSIINYQLSDNRIPVAKYQSGSIGMMCDPEKLNASLEQCKKISDDIQASDYFEEASNLVINHDSIIADIQHLEETESRQWIKWVAAGVTIVGGIALTVVTAGAAGPVVAVAVGAVVGAGGAAINSFADNYVENGSFTEGMDWEKFGKDVLIGGVTGAVTGYFGYANQIGSAIKQPVTAIAKSALQSGIKIAAENGTAFAYDIGYAVIAKKPVDWNEIGKDQWDRFKKGAENVVSDAITSGIDTKFSINTDKVGFGKKFLQETVKNTSKTVSNYTSGYILDGVESIVTGEPCEGIFSKERLLTGAKNFAVGEIGALTSAGESTINKKVDINTNTKGGKIRDTAFKSFESSLSAGIDKTADVIGEGAVNYWTDESETKGSIGDSIKDNLKLKNGEIGKSMGSAAENEIRKAYVGKNATDRRETRDKAMVQEGLNPKSKSDYKKEVDVVSFENYKTKSFLKSDYDAAVAVAGKDDYKDKTVADILGIKKRGVDTSKPIYSKEEAGHISKAPGSKNTNAKVIKNPNYKK